MNARISRAFLFRIHAELRKSDNLLARSAARDLCAVSVFCDEPFVFTVSGLERVIHVLGICSTPEAGQLIKEILG